MDQLLPDNVLCHVLTAPVGEDERLLPLAGSVGAADSNANANISVLELMTDE